MKLILLFLMLIPVSSIANSEMRLACDDKNNASVD